MTANWGRGTVKRLASKYTLESLSNYFSPAIAHDVEI